MCSNQIVLLGHVSDVCIGGWVEGHVNVFVFVQRSEVGYTLVDGYVSRIDRWVIHQ